jgi:hypothetical protein
VSTTPARQPAGVPTGGQFAAKSNPECSLDLGPEPSPEREANLATLSDLFDERDVIQNQIEVAALLLATDIVREVYPNATHIRLDTGYTDIGADPVLGAVISPDGMIEEEDFDSSVQDGVDDVAHLLWPTCRDDRAESITVELRRVLPADTGTTDDAPRRPPSGEIPDRPPSPTKEYRFNADGSAVCAHRDLSVCPKCLAADPNLVDVSGAVYLVDDPDERAALRGAAQS